MKFVFQDVTLTMMFSLWIIILQANNALEEWVFAFSLKPHQNQTSIVMNSFIDDFNLWRETWLHLAYCEWTSFSCKVVVVFINICCISWTKDLERIDILRLNRNVEVEGWREIGKIKVLEDIFFDVVLIDCTEVVESFHIFELFTHFRPKAIRNSDYGQWRPSLIGCFFKKLSLRCNAVVTDIRQHHNSIFRVLALICQNVFIEHVLTCFKATTNCSSSSCDYFVQ